MRSLSFEERVSEALDHAKRHQIAAILGVNYQTLSNWFNGRAEFPLKALVEIAKRSDYSLNWILTGEGERRVAKPVEPSIVNLGNLTDLIRRVVRDELRDIGGEVSGIDPADQVAVRHGGTVDGGPETMEEYREEEERLRKTG